MQPGQNLPGPFISPAPTVDPANGDVNLFWYPPVGDSVQTYNIYVYSGGNLYIQVTSPGNQIEEYLFTGSEKLPAGTYTFQLDYIRPDMSVGDAGDAYTFTVPDVNPPYAPTNVQATGGAGQIQVSWGTDSDSTHAVSVEFDVIVIDSASNASSTTVSSSPATITGLSADTYSVKVVARTAFGATADSSTITGIVVTGGGGSPTGSQGNTGGNGYNNMATLEFDYSGYEGTATQTNDITVLGEDHGALSGQEIVISVTGTNLQAVLAYESNWDASATGDASGTQPQPKVKFLPSACSDAIEAMYAKLKAVGSGVYNGPDRKFTDDGTGTQPIPVFGNELLGLTFTNSALDDDQLPREAIRQIEEGGVTGPANLLDVCVDLDSQTGAAAGKPEHAALLKGLFEQAVAADKVLTTDPPHATESGYKMPSLVSGDSISFPVKFHFSKTRHYQLDQDVSSGGTSESRMISIPGVNGGAAFTIDAHDETSDPYSKIYVIKLVAA